MLTHENVQPVLRMENHASDSRLKIVKFEKSPIMPTYLVAFVIGKLAYTLTPVLVFAN